MNDDDVAFGHPHDHIRLRHIAVVPNTCFVLMPFDHRFKLVYETIVSGDQCGSSRARRQHRQMAWRALRADPVDRRVDV